MALTSFTELRLAASGIAWKGDNKEAQTIAIPSEDIKWAQWIRVARNYQLRISHGHKDKKQTSDRKQETFDGFLREASDSTGVV